MNPAPGLPARRGAGPPSDPLARGRLALRILLVLFYGAAGVVHLRAPDAFLPIVPDWVPWPREVVLATGWCELAGALGLLLPPARRAAGIGLALYAVCVVPANVHHAVAGIVVPGLPSSWWYHLPRLAFQPVLVWGALFCAGVVRWPFDRRPVARDGQAGGASGPAVGPGSRPGT